MSPLPPRAARLGGLLAVTAVLSGGLLPVAPAFAVAGPVAASGTYLHAVNLTVGDEANSRGCTGTLVDRLWVLTAASCFTATPGTTVPAGKPAMAATATLSDGKVVEVVEIAPRGDRDVVLARLALPVTNIQPAALAGSVPAAGTTLTAAGFGRTKTEWVTDKVHTGAFTLNTSDTTTVAITGKGTDVICKGDTGGPLTNASGQVVAVNSRSWQGGCLDANPTETRTGAISARVDNLGQWVGSVTSRRSAAVNEAGGDGRVRWADFDGDGKPDYVTVADDGKVSVWLNKGGDGVGGGGWQSVGQVASGVTTDRKRVRLADFDGDGRFDYLVINDNGSVNVWLNRGGDRPGYDGWQGIGQVASGLTTDPGKVRFADWDGDWRTDYLVFNDANNVDVYLNRGGDQVAPWQHVGKVTTATNDRERVRFADNDGDGKADYHLIKSNGGIDLYRNRGGDVVANGWEAVGQIASGLTTDHTKVQFVDFTGDTHADYVLMGADGSATVYAWNGGDPAPNGWTGLGKVAYGGV